MKYVTLDGEKELQAQLRALGPKWREAVRRGSVATAMRIEGNARRRVTVNFGRLRSAIRWRLLPSGLGADIGVFEDARVGGFSVHYAPYIEEGTKPRRKMPPIQAITGRVEELDLWVRRKIGDPEAAWAVARKIQREGTKAQPFLGPAFEDEAPYYVDEVRRAMEAV